MHLSSIDLDHQFPRADTLALRRLLPEHVHPAKHSIDGTLQRFETLASNLRARRELESTIFKGWR